MFVIKKYKFKKENNNKVEDNKLPVFTEKVDLKAKWTYSKTNKLEGYDIGINEGHKLMISHMTQLHEILSKKNI